MHQLIRLIETFATHVIVSHGCSRWRRTVPTCSSWPHDQRSEQGLGRCWFVSGRCSLDTEVSGFPTSFLFNEANRIILKSSHGGFHPQEPSHVPLEGTSRVQTARGPMNDQHRPSASPGTRIKATIWHDHKLHNVYVVMYREEGTLLTFTAKTGQAP